MYKMAEKLRATPNGRPNQTVIRQPYIEKKYLDNKHCVYEKCHITHTYRLCCISYTSIIEYLSKTLRVAKFKGSGARATWSAFITPYSSTELVIQEDGGLFFFFFSSSTFYSKAFGIVILAVCMALQHSYWNCRDLDLLLWIIILFKETIWITPGSNAIGLDPHDVDFALAKFLFPLPWQCHTSDKHLS